MIGDDRGVVGGWCLTDINNSLFVSARRRRSSLVSVAPNKFYFVKSAFFVPLAYADVTSFDFVYVAPSRNRKQVFSSLDLRNFRECQKKFCHSAQLS